MKFRYQQLLGLSPCILTVLLNIYGMTQGNRDFVEQNVPEIARILIQLLTGLVLVRFVCWASWGSERGELLLKWAGISKQPISGSLGKFKRWWFNLDENWQPK